ncbi:hypothetical protein KSP40_PGU003394 [Platanthera guangdongensis]|uniref:Uncharacterized protein n=1 Tax=Platanthera guangdongensis TaxID=2320717 RepID=A0ABR2MPI9_9ASPA
MVRWLSNGGCGGGGRAAAGMITSIYATRLGEIALSWSRTSLGLFLVTDLRLTPGATTPAKDKDNEIADHFRLYLHPFYPWRRKGSKRRQFRTIGGRRRVVELTWDMSLATFSRERGPGPAAGYFISIAVDGVVALVAGNNEEEVNTIPRWELISQMERVRFGKLGGGLSYATKARFEEKEMVISISVDLHLEEMAMNIDGHRVFEVRRLRWNFRGSDGMVMRSGVRVRVSWDLHDWFFWQKGDWGWSPASIGRAGEAVFVFLFERCEEGDGEIRKGIPAGGEEFPEGGFGCFPKREDPNDSSSACWSTSVSSAASVEEEFCEEAELRTAGDGIFTLLVSGQKC